MNPLLRRTLTFMVMVAAGLATIVLLAEDSANPVRPVGSLQRGSSGRGLRVHDLEDNTSEELELGEVEFSVMGEVTLPDGSVVERPLYRVHIERGGPDPSGFYVVDRPRITFLDKLTGEPLGQLQAIQGRFDTGSGGLGDNFGLDMSQLVAKSMSLEGEVRGELPLDDGSVAQLSANRLEIDRQAETVFGPGLVTWKHADLTLSGHDLRWAGATRMLTYESQTTVSMRDPKTAAIITLHAEGGLRWELPEAGRGRGELLGPVHGSDGAGHSLSADGLHADADLGLLKLVGSAELRAGSETGARRFAANELRLSRDANGAFNFEEAKGQVRVALIQLDGSLSSFECDRLVRDGNLLRGNGPARWAHQGLRAEGRELRFDELTRELSLLHDVELLGAEDAPEAWRHAQLSSPRGLHWVGDETTLLGPVTGSLPDGTRLGSETLRVDRQAGSLALLGKAWIERAPLDREGEDRFEAQELHLWRNATGEWERLLAKRQVRLLATRPGEPDLELLTSELERVGQRVKLPGAFEIRQGPLSLSGSGLVFDELGRQVNVLSQAVLRSQADETVAAAELRAAAGLTWWFGAEGGASGQGHGELRGPVSGFDAEGSELHAQLVRVRGAAKELELIGAAEISRIDGSSLRGPELWLSQRPEGSLLRAPSEFELEREGLVLRGADLVWDEAAQWLEVRHKVAGEHPLWGRFEAARLVARDAEGTLELGGPCRLELIEGGWFAAQESLFLQRDELGAVSKIHAKGGVTAEREAAGAVLRLAAKELLRDEATGRLELLGNVELEREDSDGLSRLRTESTGRVVALQGPDGLLQDVFAEGRVSIERNELRAEADELTWDVAEDHLSLKGNCRFLAMGAWMSMERVEIWPNQMRWFIPRAELEFASRDDG